MEVEKWNLKEPEENYEVAMFDTNDIGMATWLRHSGFETQEVGFTKPEKPQNCYWSFLLTARLAESVDQFQRGDALIEPRNYNRLYNECKRELYDAKALKRVSVEPEVSRPRRRRDRQA
jgi:hypothetical protein